MPRTDRFRALYVLKYLWEHTDEEHPVTLAQIQIHLSEQGIEAISKTIDGDIIALQDLGFDIIRNRSTQYQYFFASRHFSSFELKLMIDAVQAAKFIPQEQTEELVKRIAQLANKNQSEALRRNLFVSKLKDNDKNIYHKGKKVVLHPENKAMSDIIVEAEDCMIQGVLVS